MAAVRVLAASDLPAAAALFARVYPEQRWGSRNACESYFREMLFGNPWRELDLPSWVAEEDGRLVGLYAVMPRRMRLRGRALRVAVGCQFMVDPERRRSLIALQLAQACLRGPQDLTLVDGASDQTRRMWSGVGGSVSLLHSLHWTRPLRPARYALSLLAQRALPGAMTQAARPLAAAADWLAARLRPNRFYREAAPADPALDARTMLAHLPEMLHDCPLRPDYDPGPLAWLLEQAARKTRHGSLRARAVRSGGRLLGWYLYYLQRGGAGEVLQVAARSGAFDQVLRRLLADAWRQGAAALRGRLDPRYAQELSARHCWFKWDSTWLLAHSRHAEVLAAVQQGNAFLSRLDGEWWLRFLGEPDPHAGGAPSSAGGPWRKTSTLRSGA
jgi:hypothetical protein